MTRLNGLVESREILDEAMTSRSDPITLDGDNSPPLGTKLLKIIDGRHRIFNARKLKGVTHVPAQVFVTKKHLGIHMSPYALQQCKEKFGPMGGTKAAYESYANTLVQGVKYRVIRFGRRHEGNREILECGFDREIGADARNDLSRLGAIYGARIYRSLVA